MKTRNLITAAVLTLGMSATAQAAPKGLENLLSRFVTSAVSATVEDIKNEVTESVLNTAYHFDSKTPNVRVEITELETAEKAADSE
jgi:hypothetical protein